MSGVWVLCRNSPAIEEAEVDAWLLRRLNGLERDAVCERANLWRVARSDGSPAGWDGWLLELRGHADTEWDIGRLRDELALLGLDPTVFNERQRQGAAEPAHGRRSPPAA